MEQKIDNPLAAGRAGDQARERFSNAWQTGQGCEKRGKQIVLHG
jgi:hypothetical protein